MDSESRLTFRDTALEAIALARETRGLPAEFCNWWELQLRTTFMQRGAWGAEWLREEAENVLHAFLAATPVTIEFMEKNSIDWTQTDRAYRTAFWRTKRLLRYLEQVRPFLSQPSLRITDRWLAQRDHLPEHVT
jgi:hypothetical protein